MPGLRDVVVLKEKGEFKGGRKHSSQASRGRRERRRRRLVLVVGNWG